MKKLSALFCIGTMILGIMGCSAGKQITELPEDTTVILEDTEDGMSEEAGSSEEEQNTDTAETTDLNEGQKIKNDQLWQEAYKALMKDLVNGNFGEDIPFFGYLPGDPEYDQLMENGYGVDGYYLYDVDKVRTRFRN